MWVEKFSERSDQVHALLTTGLHVDQHEESSYVLRDGVGLQMSQDSVKVNKNIHIIERETYQSWLISVNKNDKVLKTCKVFRKFLNTLERLTERSCVGKINF